MTAPLTPGPPATSTDLRRAQYRDQLLRTELSRVRLVAAAWRNGLGTLLAALVGFSLIKGRSDVSTVATGWAEAVGVLLLLGLLAGGWGAVLLMRAANGRASVASIRDIGPRRAAEHIEALASAYALRRGIVLTFTCASLLVAAVGTTWYGPGVMAPSLRIGTRQMSVCGTVVRADHGTIVLATADGEVSADLSAISILRPVASCS